MYKNPKCCVVTIAHRLDTIVDYDKALVLHEGKLAEFDTIPNLLQASMTKRTFFRDLVTGSPPETRTLFEQQHGVTLS